MITNKEPHFTDSQLIKITEDYDRQCEEYFKNLFKNKRMDYLTFFCLASKVREAQKKYYKAKNHLPVDKTQELLKESIRLEKILDDTINDLIANSGWTIEQMKNAWQRFIFG
jgi:hypothetical protein